MKVKKYILAITIVLAIGFSYVGSALSCGDGPPPDTHSVRVAMDQGEMLPGPGAGYLYHATVSTGRPANDYTPRVIPWHAEAATPLEANFILWRD